MTSNPEVYTQPNYQSRVHRKSQKTYPLTPPSSQKTTRDCAPLKQQRNRNRKFNEGERQNELPGSQQTMCSQQGGQAVQSGADKNFFKKIKLMEYLNM